MVMSRIAALTAAAALTGIFSTSAFAVASEGECVNKAGTVMDLQNVKHCLVPVIPEEFQGDEYAADILGVKECTGALRKTSIGDFCLVALEAKPATVMPAAASVDTSTQINTAIGDVATEAKTEAAMEVAPEAAAAEAAVEAAEEAPKKKKRSWFGSSEK